MLTDGRADDGRKTDIPLYYKLTYEPKGPGKITSIRTHPNKGLIAE